MCIRDSTNTILVNVLIKDCEIGVQAKDRSMAVLYNCTLTGNRAAVDAYKKNWRYDQGGSAFIAKSVIEDNDSTLTVGKRSNIEVVDSYVSGAFEAAKRIVVDETVDEDSRTKAATDERLEPADHPVFEHSLIKSYLSHVDPRIRGARGLE